MLKICTLLLAVATLATLSTYIQCTLSQPPDASEKCLAENSVTEEELPKLLKEFSEGRDEVDRRFKCYMKCLYNELKLTDKNGKVDATKLANQDHSGNKEQLVEAANTCNAKYSSVEDQCENIYNVVLCTSLQLEHKEEKENL